MKAKNLNHKPLTDNQYIDSSSNAREEIRNLHQSIAQYQIDDHKRYSMREFISEYSEFQYDFISLAQQRFVSVPEIDLRTMIQNFGDWYFTKRIKLVEYTKHLVGRVVLLGSKQRETSCC